MWSERMSVTRRTSIVRREFIASRRIPFSAHVGPAIITTSAGDFIQTFRLAGASFESADDDTLNNWHERLNVTWRNIASPNLSLWTHLLRRRAAPLYAPVSGEGFADRLTRRYQAKLAGETLMVNELYVTLVYRPVTGAAPSLASKFLARGEGKAVIAEAAAALEACAKLKHAILASLARYEPEPLGCYEFQGRICSRLLEFLSLLLNRNPPPIPLP